MRLYLVWLVYFISHLRYRFGNVTNGSMLIRNESCEQFTKNNSYPSSMARPGTNPIHHVLTCAQLRIFS